MQNHKLIFGVIYVLLSLFCGCAVVNVPDQYLVEANEKTKDVYGSWINVELTEENNYKDKKVSGELIASSADSIFVADSLFQAIPIYRVKFARLVVYDSNKKAMIGYTLLGTLSTLSHGWFLGITAPLWIIFGSSSAAIRSREPIYDYPANSFETLSKFARFPQGLPPTVNRSLIRAKK